MSTPELNNICAQNKNNYGACIWMKRNWTLGKERTIKRPMFLDAGTGDIFMITWNYIFNLQ